MEKFLPVTLPMTAFLSGSFWERFEDVARQNPDIPAFSAEGGELSYRELHARAGSLSQDLASLLRDMPGQVVELEGRVDAGSLVCFLAVLKSGATLFPADPSFPASLRKEFRRLALPAVLVNGSDCTMSLLPGPGRRTETLPDGDGSFPDGAAVLLWTSGSTGSPKGVLLDEKLLLVDAWNRIRVYGVKPGDRVAWTSFPALAGPLAIVSFSLLGGATLVPLSLKSTGTTSVTGQLRKDRISYFHPPLSFYRQWMDTIEGKVCLPHLRTIALGGQAVRWKDVNAFREHFTEGTALYDSYANTEMGLISQVGFGREDSGPGKDGVVPLGFAPEGRQVLVMGEDGQRVPQGEVGEVCVISRYGVSRYWKRPDLNMERFRALPGGGTMFLTGDLGRLGEDGQLELLGREDGLVKIRGFRIETAQVELALQDLPEVAETIVLPWASAPRQDEKSLVAYVVAADGCRPTVDGLRSSLKEKLPDFMIPSRFVMLAAMPRTRSGKPDRTKLPPPGESRPGISVQFVPPEGPIEEAVAKLWEEVLGVRPIGVLDDFFDLGGHSVQAAQLFGRLERVFGVQLPLARLYEGRTVRDMAGLLAGGKPSEWSCVVPIRTGRGGSPLFLVHAVGGNAIGFGPLADSLRGFDVYGIQAWGLHPRHFPHLSVEEMAAHYIGEMKGIQPEGPYRVAGYSFGGVVAYEMARQLEAAGEDVAFLGLLDRRALVTPPRKGAREATLRAWNRSTRRIKLAIRIPLAKALLAAGLPVPFMHRIATGAIKRMGIAYRPGAPYGGDLDLFLVEPRENEKDDPVQAWSPHVTGKIRSHAVPGTHNTMLEGPHVEGVANALRKAIGEARGSR